MKLLTSLLFSMSSCMLFAQSINIDFCNNAGTPAATHGGPANQQGHWNMFPTLSPLKDLGGNDLPNVVLNAGANCVGVANPNFASELNRDGYSLGSLGKTYVLQGLEPGIYKVLMISWKKSNTAFYAGEVDVNNTGTRPVSQGKFQGNYQEGVTHTVHEVSLCKGEDVVIQTRVHYGEGVANGLQIMKIQDNTQTLNPDFQLKITMPQGNTQSFLVEATTTNIHNVPGFGFYWRIEELDSSGQVIPGTVLENPSNWWATPTATTFPGYPAGSNATPDGIFLQGHTYRIVRGVWGDCFPWAEISKIINVCTNCAPNNFVSFGDSISLKSFHDKFMVANPGGSLNADRLFAGDWEQFLIVDPNNPSNTAKIHFGDAIALQSHHQTYLVAEANGKANADRTAIGAWEQFTLVNPYLPTDKGPIRDGDKIGLLGAHNRYLVAEQNGHVNADRILLGAWEQWKVKKK